MPRAPYRERHHRCEESVEEEQSWIREDVAGRLMDEDGLVEGDGTEGSVVGGGEIDKEGEAEVCWRELGVEGVLRKRE